MRRRDQDLYALLEVQPGASDEELRRAYKRLARLFDPEGLVLYGLYRRQDAEILASRLKEAVDTLLDPTLRRAYDRSIFPEGHPSLRRADQRVAATPPAPKFSTVGEPLRALKLPFDTPHRGPLITRVRELAGVSLEDIADRTKISMFNLRALEAERYADLPAPVYLRGSLRQVARIVKLDEARLQADYMAAYDEWAVSAAAGGRW